MRLATFNILHGRSPSDGVVDIDRLAAAVRLLDPDILALQEVDRGQPRSHHADLTEVAAAAMGAVSHRFVAAIAGTPGQSWTPGTGAEARDSAAYGISLLSRFPVQDWQAWQLPHIPFRFPLWRPSEHTMVLLHDEPRFVLIGVVRTPAGPITVASTHLSFVPRWNRHQLEHIRRRLVALDLPAVVMGDLNMPGAQASRLTGFRSLATLPTFPLDRPDRQLDHILVRGDVGTVTSAGSPALAVSDHRPLVVEVDGCVVSRPAQRARRALED